MDIGEEVDELTDGIVWRDLRQEFILVNPTKGELVASHLHPDGVDGIGWNGPFVYDGEEEGLQW
jgi:hypothetical protein